MRTLLTATLLLSLTATCGRNQSNPDAGSDNPSSTTSAKGEAIAGPIDGGLPGPALVINGPVLLADALAQLNRFTTERALPVRQLSVDDMRTWFDDSKYFAWTKAEREVLQEHMDLGDLTVGWTLELEQIVILDGSPWRVTLCGPPTPMAGGYLTSCGTVAEGGTLYLWVSESRRICEEPTHDLCDEPFLGPSASMTPGALSSTVEVRVDPIQVAGEPAVPELAERDALAVSVKLSADSLPALVDYFAVGYDRAALEARMRSLLGAEPNRWVQVQELMFGWIRERANTFPQANDNDVCHGPARMFYSDILYNGDFDRSTEAVAVLLTDHYCRVADDAPPRFGDYLYSPGAHSARFILKDPASGRDIVFTVQSGGISAYRFYWADEDMSGKPFAHQPMPEYRQALVDTWRRCR